MGYSKITFVEVFNFMSFKHAKATFDERGIINLKGYNHSGKSALERAVAVCLMNMYASKQAKFIHHGEDYFRVIVAFDDGVSIVKDKYINGQSLYEMYMDGECIYTSKQGSKLGKVENVPKPIDDYLGLIKTDLGYLNYQVRKDPLWLVDTKGSDNYNSVNEVLKTQELARANALLNTDKNEVNSDIVRIESELQTAELTLQSYKSAKEDLIVFLSEKEIEMQALERRYSAIHTINNTLKELSEIKDIPELETVDYTRLGRVVECNNTFNSLENIVIYPEVEGIPVDKLKSIAELNSLVKQYEGVKVPPEVGVIPNERLQSVYGLSRLVEQSEVLNTELLPIELEDISIEKYTPLSRLQKELKELVACVSKLEELEKVEQSLSNEKDKLLKDAENSGVRFVTCKNCGTLMEVKN